MATLSAEDSPKPAAIIRALSRPDRTLAALVLVIGCTGAPLPPIANPDAEPIANTDAEPIANTDANPIANPDAGPPSDPTAELIATIDALVAPHVDPSGAPQTSIGLVIGVVTADSQLVRGYGLRAIGEPAAPDGRTSFEIGSVTKVFTGALLASRALDASLQLEDEVARLLPGVSVPRFGERGITLLDLATHTSGLPVMPDNLVGAPTGPATGYTPERLYDFLARHELERAPGSAYRYSNLGLGLLGHALLVSSSAPSYDAMIRELLVTRGGLPMLDTRVAIEEDERARLAVGHDGAASVPPVRIDTLEGSGALRSTGDDMLHFLRAAMGLEPALDEIFALVRQPQRDTPRGRIGLALDERVDPELGSIFEKPGSTIGFSAHVIFTTTTPVGVVVLSNSKGFAAGALADEVLRRIARR